MLLTTDEKGPRQVALGRSDEVLYDGVDTGSVLSFVMIFNLSFNVLCKEALRPWRGVGEKK
jgi:hypothetical protein